MGKINVDYDVLNQKGSPAWYSDLFANIPTPGYTGRMFISTDTFAFYRDNGTGWDLTGGPGIGTITGSGVSGQVSFFSGTQVLGGSTNLIWDNTNNRLGIGVASPTVTLEISGSVKATALVKSGGTSAEILLADGTTTPTSTFQAAITLTTTGTTGASTLVGATLNVPTYTFVSSVSALTLGTSGTDLTSTVANSTTTPTITLNVPTASATNRGALSSADWTTFNNKQATITLTTTGTSGAATLVGATLNVPNYTNVGTVTSVAALTLGTSGTDLSSTVANSTSTPVITLNVPTASATNRGALSSADWSTFNSKQATISVTAPVVLTGATISMPAATTSVNGYLTSTDWNTFNNKSNTNGTVTSVVALTIGTTGIDITSTAVTTTTTPVITLNIPTASASNRGALSSTDWTIFNNKQATLSLTTTGTSGAATLVANTLNVPNYGSGAVTGSGTTNYIPKFTSASAIGNSVAYDNGSQIGISQTTLFTKFSVADSLAATSVGSNFNPGIVNIQNTNTTNGNLSLIGFQDASAFINLAAFGAINEVHSGSPNNVKGSLAFYTKNSGTSYVTEKMRLDASGNLGLGITPSAWGSGYIALQIPSGTYGGGSFLSDNGSPAISANAYNNAGWKYVNTDFATIYQSRSGEHQWFNAPSGTAGNAITFTQAMTLTNSGNLLIGTSTISTGISSNDLLTIGKSGSTSNAIIFSNGSTTNWGYLLAESTKMVFGSGSSSNLTFETNAGNERMRITSGGDIYVKTAGAGLYWGASQTADIFVSPSTNSMYIEYPTGYSAIFRTQAGTQSLQLASTGAATFSSSVTAANLILNGSTTTAIDLTSGTFGYALDIQNNDFIRQKNVAGTLCLILGMSTDDNLYVRGFSGINLQVNNGTTALTLAVTTGAATFSNSVTLSRPSSGATILSLEGSSAYGDTSTINFCDSRSYIKSTILVSANGNTDLSFATYNGSSVAQRFYIADTGAATFSSSVTANSNLFVTNGSLNFGGTATFASTDPAIYRVAGNDLAIAIGSTERLRFTSVGILNSTTRANFLGATDNALFSLNSGGTLYTVGFSPTATASSTNTLTLTTGTTTWIYTGTGTATWTLPNPSGNNQIYWIKNAGTGIITLNAFSGTNIINNAAASVGSITIAVGGTAVIAQDGNVKSYQLQ